MHDAMTNPGSQIAIGPNELPLMITPKQAVALTGLPYDYVLQLCKESKAPHIRRGNWRYRINRIKLIEYLNSAGLESAENKTDNKTG